MDYRWHIAHDTCDLYAQRVWADGVLDTLPLPQSNWIGRPAFERDSVNYPLSIASGQQGGPQPDISGGSRIIEDGGGGIFAAWHDSRSGQFEIYAQHITGSGFPYWTEGGIPASNLSGLPSSQQYPVLATDGAGGILAIWQEQAVMIPYKQIRASRVTSAGMVAWEIGVFGTLWDQLQPFCISDGSGGAWVAWEDRTNTLTGYDIAVAHITNAGAASYQRLALPENQWMCKIALDGYGGVFVVMVGSSGSDAANILAARVRSDMSVAWVVTLCNATNSQQAPWIVASEVGRAIAGWVDPRNPATSSDIYAQKVDTAGNILWVAWPQGRPICTASASQSISFPHNPWIAADGAGGAILAWEDYRISPGGVYAQRVDGFGNTLWTNNGVLVCNVKDDGGWGGIVSDDHEGAILCWCDYRWTMDTGCNIYAQRIYSDGSLARPEEACEFLGVWNSDIFSGMGVVAAWDMEKEDWCLCSSPNLPLPPYYWCPQDIAGTIVVGLSSTVGDFNYALLCNCMDIGPAMDPHVYYRGMVPLPQPTAVACDDRGPEVPQKSFWWGDQMNQLLLHTDLWGNILHGPFSAEDLGIAGFPVTGLTKDEVNHHLWAICRGDASGQDVFYEFNIVNPATPTLLQGPIPVLWSGGDISGAAGLEYNNVVHRLIAINQTSQTAECFRDNDPPFAGMPPWPGVDFISFCELLEASRPFGVAVKDGRGPERRGVLEVIDQTAAGTFPLLAFEPPCAFPGPCPDPDSLVVVVQDGAIALMWPRVPQAVGYNVYQASEPFPTGWLHIAATSDTLHIYVPPAQETKSFFHVKSVCEEGGEPAAIPMDNHRCKR
ncbi:MAG: hypothetical protein V1784_11585 [bacterium]